jgi:hypothetical protein
MFCTVPAAALLPPERRGRQAVAGSRSPPSRSAGGTSERARQRVVLLVIALFVLALTEGALRKWVAPQLGTYIFFLRDPVLLLAYAVATQNGLWPRRSAFLSLSIGMAAFGALLFVLQAASGGYSEHRLVLGAYGWRAYFLYAPLAFLVGSTFRRADLLKLFKVMLWLAIPIAVLVAAQFAAAPGAPINVGISEDKEFQFHGVTLNAEKTRPTGPFASGAGQQQYVAAAFAVLIAFFVAPRYLPQPGMLTLLSAAGGVLSCIALSGSRGTVLQCGLSIVMAMVLGFIGRGGALKGRALLWPALLTVSALAAYPIVFPEGYAAFTGRWAGASAAEAKVYEDTGVFGRALYGMVDFMRLLDLVPGLGYGLGFGGNAAITLNSKVDGVAVGGLAETDFARHIVDLGPVFGLGYIVFRLCFAAWLTRLAFRATRQFADPMPVLLWSYVAYVIVMGQLTGQGTINFFGWLFAGLLIASGRPADVAPGVTSTARSVPIRRPARRPINHIRGTP